MIVKEKLPPTLFDIFLRHALESWHNYLIAPQGGERIEGMIIMTQTTAALAASLETTPRTLRKFLRSPESGIESVGKGSRYALPASKREVNALKKKFTAWDEARNAPQGADEGVEAIDAPDDADAPAGIEFDALENPLDA